MVFAHRVHLDVLHQHHFVGLRLEDRRADDRPRVLLVALGVEAHRLLESPRRVEQALALRIWIDLAQDLCDRLLHRGFRVAFAAHVCLVATSRRTLHVGDCLSSLPRGRTLPCTDHATRRLPQPKGRWPIGLAPARHAPAPMGAGPAPPSGITSLPLGSRATPRASHRRAVPRSLCRRCLLRLDDRPLAPPEESGSGVRTWQRSYCQPQHSLVRVPRCRTDRGLHSTSEW